MGEIRKCGWKRARFGLFCGLTRARSENTLIGLTDEDVGAGSARVPECIGEEVIRID